MDMPQIPKPKSDVKIISKEPSRALFVYYYDITDYENLSINCFEVSANLFMLQYYKNNNPSFFAKKIASEIYNINSKQNNWTINDHYKDSF